MHPAPHMQHDMQCGKLATQGPATTRPVVEGNKQMHINGPIVCVELWGWRPGAEQQE
eukprot:CAMPEP_0202866674 /NCGR_PEP_ID=MMETSP1391-20130828/8300_1 /ASSEMBLY_ACC=CAM_ASM_000867 /TAXON_ID=1034604 /ORGANISM="Chlamydomonas leiostraca, Strain SAG 11-49" /LENGTH=56 /DNA_ID=CAMNT_0049546647 /DNA_START=29 /DNA_END=199 /DNA_ORIENTATION=+